MRAKFLNAIESQLNYQLNWVDTPYLSSRLTVIRILYYKPNKRLILKP